jgi:hypothetical protein
MLHETKENPVGGNVGAPDGLDGPRTADIGRPTGRQTSSDRDCEGNATSEGGACQRRKRPGRRRRTGDPALCGR